MTPEELAELRAVADARKSRAEAELAQVCRKEAQLRGLLRDIAAQFEAGMQHAAAGPSSMQGLGAYLAWVDFARRRQAALNRDLSLVLAEKSERTAALRRHLGRREALDTLRRDALRARAKAQEARENERMLERYLQGGGSAAQRHDVVLMPDPQRIPRDP
jgi:hypothetical protein